MLQVHYAMLFKLIKILDQYRLCSFPDVSCERDEGIWALLRTLLSRLSNHLGDDIKMFFIRDFYESLVKEEQRSRNHGIDTRFKKHWESHLYLRCEIPWDYILKEKGIYNRFASTNLHRCENTRSTGSQQKDGTL